MNCLSCGLQIEESKSKDLLICENCFSALFALEKTTIRKPKFTPPTKITDKVFLGCENSQLDLEYLRSIGVTHVLQAAMYCDQVQKEELVYKVLEIDDSPDENIKLHFEDSIDFMKNAEGNVLVHCVSGISRSATIVIAYLMKIQDMTFQQAFDFVKERRSIVSPNSGFRE